MYTTKIEITVHSKDEDAVADDVRKALVEFRNMIGSPEAQENPMDGSYTYKCKNVCATGEATAQDAQCPHCNGDMLLEWSGDEQMGYCPECDHWEAGDCDCSGCQEDAKDDASPANTTLETAPALNRYVMIGVHESGDWVWDDLIAESKEAARKWVGDHRCHTVFDTCIYTPAELREMADETESRPESEIAEWMADMAGDDDDDDEHVCDDDCRSNGCDAIHDGSEEGHGGRVINCNHYTCPECEHEWSDEHEAMPDMDCEQCGTKHVSPTHSEEIWTGK